MSQTVRLIFRTFFPDEAILLLPRFLEVLAYLNVTPQEFFTFELDRPVLMNDLLPLLKQLRDDQLTALIPLLIQWIKDSGSTGAGESISNTKK